MWKIFNGSWNSHFTLCQHGEHVLFLSYLSSYAIIIAGRFKHQSKVRGLASCCVMFPQCVFPPFLSTFSLVVLVPCIQMFSITVFFSTQYWILSTKTKHDKRLGDASSYTQANNICKSCQGRRLWNKLKLIQEYWYGSLDR